MALLGLALSQGWIGDGGGDDESVNSGDDVVRISVEPPTLEFTKIPGQEAVKTVTVTNEGTGPITLATDIRGDDAGSFTPNDEDCTRSEIPPNRSCEVSVTFDAGAGRDQARLVVSVADTDEAQEVELVGTSSNLLG